MSLFLHPIAHADDLTLQNSPLSLQQRSSFFRLSFDNAVQMPNGIPSMGLAGFDYFADLSPLFYAGIGGFGAMTGTQGGLFAVGIEGGAHPHLVSNWLGDIGLFVGGGGGKSSLTGGGLMVRPHAGIAYQLPWARLGVFYSYIMFPSGEIRSQQVGLNLDLMTSFSYLKPNDRLVGVSMLDPQKIEAVMNQFVHFQHNDFSILFQSYQQRAGTKNIEGTIQDGRIGLVGAEFDHYFSPHAFWWLKTSGALSGIPNGYMDVIGGLGYHWPLWNTHWSLIPQFGLGAGGGGQVETGGGFLVNPLMGIEWAILPSVSVRASSGYLWAPQGELKAIPIAGELIWHLNFAEESIHPTSLLQDSSAIMGWRIQVLNQTYLHPQRSFDQTTSSIQMIGVQIDQLFSPWFFLSYQGMGAYSGYHAGGYATGMIGPGIQTPALLQQSVQLFAECLVGAGGGGGLALGGGSLIEPQVGVRYALTPYIGLQGSIAQLKALRNSLNTPVINVGLLVRFDTLNQGNSSVIKK